MTEMEEAIGEVDSPTPSTESPETGGFHAAPIAQVKAWLALQFHEAGKRVPDFDYTPQTISYLHNVVNLSQTKTEAATIVLNDLYQKSAEYRAQGFSAFIFITIFSIIVCALFCFLVLW